MHKAAVGQLSRLNGDIRRLKAPSKKAIEIKEKDPLRYRIMIHDLLRSTIDRYLHIDFALTGFSLLPHKHEFPVASGIDGLSCL